MGMVVNLLWFLASAGRAVLPYVLLILLLRWFFRRPENLPPGPRELPFTGVLPAAVWGLMRGLQPHHVLGKYADRYGSVFRVGLLNKTVVFLDDFKTTKAAFQHPQLNDRPAKMGKGVTGTSGPPWVDMRRFGLNVLRSFGVGKSSFEEQIGTEGEELLKEMSAYHGKPFNPKPKLSSAIANVICSVVFGKRYDYDDPDFEQLLASMSQAIESTGPSGVFYTFYTLLKRVPLFKSKIKLMETGFIQINAFVSRHIDSHRSNFNPHNLNDFVDVYLQEIQRNAVRNGTSVSENGTTAKPERYSHLNDTNMFYTVRDLFTAGSETTVTTLEWCLLYMAIYPEIQERVQAEIDAVVGRNRLPRLADKPGLNLTRATIWEVQRMASIVPLGLPHAAASDTHFQGFLIPKDTVLMSNLWRINRNPELWPEPEKFNPERFLDDEGKAFKPEEFIPFGIGRRICLGEHLAKMELFIFFSYFMHQFTFKKPANAPPYTLEGKSSITFSPLPFEICAVEREEIRNRCRIPCI